MHWVFSETYMKHTQNENANVWMVDKMDLVSRYVASDVVKLDILLNGQPVDAMATIVHKLKAQRVGRELVDKLKKYIDRLPNCF